MHYVNLAHKTAAPRHQHIGTAKRTPWTMVVGFCKTFQETEVCGIAQRVNIMYDVVSSLKQDIGRLAG